MVLSSVQSIWLWCSNSEATWQTWSTEPFSWASVWTCSLTRTPMLQLSGSALSARRHLPSRLGPRGRQARATGHRVSRSSMLFCFLVLSCYCYMFTWTIAICPGFLRAGQMLFCFFVLSCYCYMFSKLCWFPVNDNIFGDSDLYLCTFCQSFFDNLI
jgi:hypothetical protein